MIEIIPTLGLRYKRQQTGMVSIGRLAQWTGSEYVEIVRVFYKGKYEQLVIDESGLLKNKPLNRYATELYLENVRVHDKRLYMDSLYAGSRIVGTAVLLTAENKLT